MKKVQDSDGDGDEYIYLVKAGIRGAHSALRPELLFKAEDISATAALKTMTKMRCQRVRNPGRYCFTTARREALAQNRKFRKEMLAAQEVVIGGSADVLSNNSTTWPEPSKEEIEEREAIVALLQLELPKAFSRLNDIDKEVLKLLFWDELNSAQIATVLRQPPFCKALSDSAIRHIHRRALDRLRSLIVDSLKANPTAVRLLADSMENAQQGLELLRSIRPVVFANNFSIQLMADNVVGTDLTKAQPITRGDSDKSAAPEAEKVQPMDAESPKIEQRKEELVGEVVSGVIEYSDAVTACRAELGPSALPDFNKRLRKSILEALRPLEVTNTMRQKLENIYSQSKQDLP